MAINAVLKQTASAATQWTSVCALDDIVPDTGVAALLNGEQIAIFRVGADDALYAIGNHDPFSHANVLARGIVGDIGGELVVASPVYKQHFSLNSGACLEETGVCVPVYAVRLSDGIVQIAL